MSIPTPKQDYEHKGFCVVPYMIPQKTCTELGRLLCTWQTTQHITPNQYGILYHNLFLALPQFAEIIDTYSLKKHAEEIYGLPLILFQDNLIWKPPHGTTSISWHQDYSYWPLEAPKGITMWIALDDSDEENGCLIMSQRSHKRGECIPNDFITDTPASWATDFPPLHIDPQSIHPLVLKQGMISVHHPLCAHTSGNNTSERHRRGWSLTFVEPDIQWDPDHAPHPYSYQFSIEKGKRLHNLPTLLQNRYRRPEKKC